MVAGEREVEVEATGATGGDFNKASLVGGGEACPVVVVVVTEGEALDEEAIGA